MSAPLADKDANATMMDVQPTTTTTTTTTTHSDDIDVPVKDADNAVNANSMEFHRKILADKIAQQHADQQAQYVSPSDGLMSPCTAKLSALRNKKMDKAMKPKSLFQKASARNLGSSLFDSKSVPKPPLSKSASKPVSSLAVAAAAATAPSTAAVAPEPEAEAKTEAQAQAEEAKPEDVEMELETTTTATTTS